MYKALATIACFAFPISWIWGMLFMFRPVGIGWWFAGAIVTGVALTILITSAVVDGWKSIERADEQRVERIATKQKAIGSGELSLTGGSK